MNRFGVLRFASAIVILFPLLVLAHHSTAQSGSSETIAGTPVFLRAGQATQRSQVRPPSQITAGIQSSTFSVTYTGFPVQAQAAFQAAVDIWQTQISSPVVIRVSAQWTSLGSGILGAATAAAYVRDFSGAPVANTYYPIALANKLAGSDLEPASVDIIAQFNSSFSAWYLATDGKAPLGQYDFESVVLHELGHGLGFIGSMDVSNNQGNWGAGTGLPFIYDRFAVNGSGQALLNTNLFPNPSAALKTPLTSRNIFFNGPQAVQAAGGAAPKLYAPSSWEEGSSYSHLDEVTYPAGNANSLMTPILNDGESVHSPGPITLGMFADMGWNATPSQATATTASTSTVVSTPPTATVTVTPLVGKNSFLPNIVRKASDEQSTATMSLSAVVSATVARTETNPITATRTLTATLTSTVSASRTATRTFTPTVSATITATSTSGKPATATQTTTSTRTPSSTPTTTSTPTITRTPSVTVTQEGT